jgi:hypothetical protein
VTREWVLAAVMLVPCVPGSAHAEDLRDVAARVRRAWSAAGGTVAPRDARFVMEDETMTIDLRPDASAKATDCRHVALIGSRGMSFHVTAAPGAEDDTLQVASAAGVVELQGCAGVPDWVKLKSDSGKGALETVVASAPTVLPPVSAILLERTGGVLPSPPEPGPLPALPPPSVRASFAEGRLARDGFMVRPQLTWEAGDDGKGRHDFVLEEGCHRLDLFAVEPKNRETGRHARLDLDGALHDANGDLLADDQSVSPDVRLEACVGATTKVSVSFEGAPHGGPVLVTHAFHALPPHLPTEWGPEVRARFASVMVEHHVFGVSDEAVVLAQGASGSTPIAIDLEPGACYVAVAALERGHGRSHGLALHATVGARVSEDERGAKGDAAIVAFCARDATRGRLDVDARSSSSGWGVAVFRMVGGAWGEWP